MSSSFSSTGTVEVEVIPIDEVVAANGAPVYLKFDVEGAEWEALRGCERLLTHARPLMAISVYHRPDDLWQLPLSVAANSLNRSMGLPDLYPFVLPVAVLDKMQFIHTVIDEVTSESRGPAAIAG